MSFLAGYRVKLRHRLQKKVEMSALASLAGFTQEHLAQLRVDTPSTARALHFNHAGASPPPEPVLNRVIRHLRREAEIGGYAAANEAAAELAEVYRSIAELIGASDPSEVALVESATVAWMKAFSCVPLGHGDVVVLAGQAEYAAQYVEMLRASKEQRFELAMAPIKESGEVDVDKLKSGLDGEWRGRAKLVVMTHVPSNGGLVNPAELVGQICKEREILYILDGCQSVGQIDVNVSRIGCDFLAATGRKFLRGPRGTGFLYARSSSLQKVKEPAFLDHWAAPITADGKGYEMCENARRFEYWESAIANRLGLGVAVQYLLTLGAAKVEARVAALAEELRQQLLSSVAGLVVTDLGQKRCGIVCFHLEHAGGPSAMEVKAALEKRAIFVAVSVPASAPLDGFGRSLPDLIRASVHYLNTQEELAKLVAAVAEIASHHQKR